MCILSASFTTAGCAAAADIDICPAEYNHVQRKYPRLGSIGKLKSCFSGDIPNGQTALLQSQYAVFDEGINDKMDEIHQSVECATDSKEDRQLHPSRFYELVQTAFNERKRTLVSSSRTQIQEGMTLQKMRISRNNSKDTTALQNVLSPQLSGANVHHLHELSELQRWKSLSRDSTMRSQSDAHECASHVPSKYQLQQFSGTPRPHFSDAQYPPAHYGNHHPEISDTLHSTSLQQQAMDGVDIAGMIMHIQQQQQLMQEKYELMLKLQALDRKMTAKDARIMTASSMGEMIFCRVLKKTCF